MATSTYIVVGLGNPGAKYPGTRHNIGFDVVDNLARKHGIEIGQQKWDAFSVRIMLGEANVLLVKPQTYMNLSGKSVVRFVDFYKVSPERIIVVHDDLDMSPGRLKLVLGGGAGGHNGIRSIVSSIGTEGFFRLKIGIGRPGHGDTPKEIPVERYVLTSFSLEEAGIIEERMENIIAGLDILISGDPSRAMNFLNSFK